MPLALRPAPCTGKAKGTREKLERSQCSHWPWGRKTALHEWHEMHEWHTESRGVRDAERERSGPVQRY